MKRIETMGCRFVMQQFVITLKALVSPRERLGSKGFVIVFLCTKVSLLFFAEGVAQQWLWSDPYPDWQFNFVRSVMLYLGGFALDLGLWPLALLLLYYLTSMSFAWRQEMGYWFFAESIVVILLYILYLIQCIRRCRDLGKRWYYCLIPLFNPMVLLFGKSVREDHIA